MHTKVPAVNRAHRIWCIFDAKEKGQNYLYPHDSENHWIYQQYLPDELKNEKYYIYGDNKNEQAFKQYWEKINNEY